MNIHTKYGLEFSKVVVPNWGKFPKCSNNIYTNLQFELSSILDMSSSKEEGLVDTILEETNKILAGTWDGVEEEGDNKFITETNEAIRLDLNDGFAYLGQEDYGWSELPKIPLKDLKAILEEWISFRNSVYA